MLPNIPHFPQNGAPFAFPCTIIIILICVKPDWYCRVIQLVEQELSLETLKRKMLAGDDAHRDAATDNARSLTGR